MKHAIIDGEQVCSDVTDTAAASQVSFGVKMKDLAICFYCYGVPSQKCIT